MPGDIQKEFLSVLIPDGESEHALNVIRCLGQLKNVRVFVLSNTFRPSIRYSRYCFQFINYENKKNDSSRLKAIYDTVKKVKPDVLLPVDIPTISLLAEDKGNLSGLTALVPLPFIGSFKIANDKGLLAEWLKKNQIPSPATLLLKKDNIDFDKALSSFSFPALLKPCRGSGGLGIEIFQNEKAFREYCKEQIFSEEFILQSFINGYDVDCSILCENGKILAYTIQKGFINGRGNFRRAAGLDFINDCKTYNLVRDVAEKFNWSGVAHIDLRYDLDTQQINLIEINPRYWGSLMGSFCSGVNFPHLQCLSALKNELVKSEAKEMRYIQGRSAIKSMAKNMFYGVKKQPEIETSFKFILKDPMPTISYFFNGMLKRKSKSN